MPTSPKDKGKLLLQGRERHNKETTHRGPAATSFVQHCRFGRGEDYGSRSYFSQKRGDVKAESEVDWVIIQSRTTVGRAL